MGLTGSQIILKSASLRTKRNNCGLLNHFAKVCQKPKKLKPHNPKKKTVNTVDKEPHPEVSVNILHSSKLYESDYSSREDNMVALIQNDIAKIEPLNMLIKFGIISPTLLVDFGSAGSILNRSRVARNKKQLKCFLDSR